MGGRTYRRHPSPVEIIARNKWVRNWNGGHGAGNKHQALLSHVAKSGTTMGYPFDLSHGSSLYTGVYIHSYNRELFGNLHFVPCDAILAT